MAMVVAGALWGGPSTRADTNVGLLCVNSYNPPLIPTDFVNLPQVLYTTITILTDSDTNPSGDVTHAVYVVNPNNLYAPNVAGFYFTVHANGTINGSDGTAQASDVKVYPGSNQGGVLALHRNYYSTVIGVYSFAGDNFPFAAGIVSYAFPPVYDQRQFILDEVSGVTPPPNNIFTVNIQSDYAYNQWALPHFGIYSFLGEEGPFIPGATTPAPTNTNVTFDLRGADNLAALEPCPTCNKCPTCHGMAVASLDRFHAGTVITDTPISYTPPIGLGMDFTVFYHQRLEEQPATPNFSNLGPNWQFNWMSYISGGPTNGQTAAINVAMDGNPYTYGGYVPITGQGLGSTQSSEGDFTDNQGFTHATLHYRQGPERYELWLPDGSVETFALGAGAAPNRYFFLTSITDPQGNVTTLNYDPVAASGGEALLTSISDPMGGQLILGYDTANPLLVTSVTRSNDGLSAQFQYTGGQLASSTDTLGMTSSFQYAAGTTFINLMTTPYGNTSFGSNDGATSFEADMTNPLGQTERVEYQQSLSTSLVPAAESSAPTTTGLTIDNSNLNNGNSFYWTRRAMAVGAPVDSEAFYGLAQVTHWAGSGQGSILVPLSTKLPLEGRVWYNYPGQTNPDFVDTTVAGGSTDPSITARLMDGGATQASFASYNDNGLITQIIDPLGRTTNYSYDTTAGIDLLLVTQTNGSGQDILNIMTYNGQHEPLTIKDASGQTTTLGYCGNGQLNTIEDALNETTTLAYDSNGYLYTVTGPVTGAVTTYHHDSAGRVDTITDSEGYVVHQSYDNLDRLTAITYPDSTSDQTVYNRLDVARKIDRQGRITMNQYDAIGELLQTTDPLGRTTKYTWCTCGGLATLTDANGNVTTWSLDLQGRATAKTYADTSAISYAYESNTSRLHAMTDARSNTATYAYNLDNTLASTTWTPTASPDPSVSFGYDTVYNRVTSMTDSTGTTTYGYNPITSTATLGAGRLASVSVPIASSTATITYTYDALGRATGRGIDVSTTNANNVSASFDSLGRVTGVTNPLGSFTYAYVDQTIRLSGVTYPSGTGLSTSYSYYPVSNTQNGERLQEIQNSKGATQLSDFQYTYNAVGTIATWQQQADSSTAVVNTLTYDNADQLTGAVQSGGGSASNAYNYDPAGNRLAETTGSGTTVGRFNDVNQLTAFTSSATTQTVAGHTSAAISSATVNALPASITSSTNFSATVPLPEGTNLVSVVAQPTTGPITTQQFKTVTSGTTPTALTYDNNGNTLTDESGNAYAWDAVNRLTKITYPSTAYTTFAYDGLSRRTQIAEYDSTSSHALISTKNYLWVGTKMAEERDASNTVTKRFFPQGEQQIVSGTASPYYYTRDHLGSVREMTDGSGTIQARYDYDAYGRVTTITGTVPSDFQYAGYYTHAASGLNFTLNRAYDSNTARWLSRDPYIDADGNDPEIASGPNLYLYVGNNPINKVDPLGLDGQFAGMFTPSNNQGTNPPASPAVAAGMGAAALTGTGILAGMAAVDLWPILARDLKIDGPAARGGRICQLRLGPTPIARLDYHPIPGSGGQPVLHLNIGPGQGPNSIHIPLWPY